MSYVLLWTLLKSAAGNPGKSLLVGNLVSHNSGLEGLDELLKTLDSMQRASGYGIFPVLSPSTL